MESSHIVFRYEPRGQRYLITLNIYQDVLKSRNLLHKQGFVDSQFGTTVIHSQNLAIQITEMYKLAKDKKASRMFIVNEILDDGFNASAQGK